MAKNVEDVREPPWTPHACPISIFATAVLAILLITLIIACSNDTRESRTRRALSVARLTADDHLQVLGVAEATHGNLGRRHMEIYIRRHNFPFIPLPFPLLCSTMAGLRVGHSLCNIPRFLGHAPAPLVSDLHGCLQHNVSRHENGRKS